MHLIGWEQICQWKTLTKRLMKYPPGCIFFYVTCYLYWGWASKETYHSSERHSFRSRALTWFIFGHRLAIVLLTKHISKTNLFESKRSKMQWNIKRSLFKNHRNCSPPRHRVRHGQKPVRRLHNLGSFVEVLSEQFLWFLKKLPFAMSMQFFPFWQKQSFDFSDVFVRSTMA